MSGSKLPHPIPYQGSKRLLAQRILGRFSRPVRVLYEPFAGSAAVSLAAAGQGRATKIHLGDSLEALMHLWREILDHPAELADDYGRLWKAQADDPRAYYDEVRARFNREGGAAELLYLLARCVKSAVRFNGAGEFNQSPDNRRLGTRPERMRENIFGAHRLLAPCTVTTAGDYAELLSRATSRDLVYMDPPYQGTSGKRDSRYHQGLDLERFVDELERLRQRAVPFLISFDGRTGEKTFGPELPSELGLKRLEIRVGRSTQATLQGKRAETVESLYLSPELQR